MKLASLRWGVLGAARIVRSVIPAIRGVDGQSVVAVASRSAETASECAAQWQIPRAFGSYAELLADREVDAIYIPLPNHLHAEWTVRAAEARKHVLCEKPLALSVEEVDRVRRAAGMSAVHVAEAFMYRHHPQTRLLTRLVAQGAVGELRGIRACFSFTLTRPADVRWIPEFGGGSLWDVGCYPVSLARLLAGEPDEVMGHPRWAASGVDVGFAGTLRFPGNVFAQFDCAFDAPFRTEAEIVGAEGMIRVAHPFKPTEHEVVVLSRGDAVEEHVVEAPPLYEAQIADFARVVATREPPGMTLDDSRANVATLVALLASARQNRPVSVSPPQQFLTVPGTVKDANAP
jgi:D-xylose 1-dehydrogenase (NADP+, D-xylono-1,5-lactone-forming)